MYSGLLAVNGADGAGVVKTKTMFVFSHILSESHGRAPFFKKERRFKNSAVGGWNCPTDVKLE